MRTFQWYKALCLVSGLFFATLQGLEARETLDVTAADQPKGSHPAGYPTTTQRYVSRLTGAERAALGRKFYQRLSPHYSDERQVLTSAVAEEQTSKTGIPDGEELLMDLRIENMILSEPMPVEKSGDGFLVRLADFVEVFDFPIDVDEKTGRAEGWFIRENNVFQLNLANSTLRIGDRELTVGPRAVIRRGDQIWLDSVVAADWFSIGFDTDYQQLLIELHPSEPLPVQSRQRRANMRVGKRPRNALPPQNPYVPPPHPLIGPPSLDTQVVGSLAKPEDGDLREGLNYAVNGQAAVLGGALKGYVSGDKHDGLRTARFALAFKEPDGLFGNELATQFTVGDIYSVRTSILGSGRLERGAYLSNLPLGRSLNLDTTTIAGDSFPGYDVQLFRDGALVGKQDIGEDGRYEFDEVPVFPGINEFRLVFFSPQGQVLEESRTVNVDPAKFAKSRFLYELSLTDQNETLLNDTIDTSELDKGLRAAGRMQYTLGHGLALEAGFESLIDDAQRRTLTFLGVNHSTRKLRTRAVLTADVDGNVGGEALIQAQVGGQRIRLEHKELGDIGLRAGGRPVERNTRANVNGSFRLGGSRSPSISYDLFANREEFIGGLVEHEFGLGLGTFVRRIGVSTNFSYKDSNKDDDKGQFIGASQVMAVRGRWQGRVVADYEISPNPRILKFGGDLGYKFSKNLRSEFRIRHQNLTNRTSGALSVDYDAGFARIAPRITYDSDGLFTAFITLRFSTAREPQAGKWHFLSRPIHSDGHLSARVYLDENENDVWDEGERPLEDVNVTAIHQRREVDTSDKGIAFFPRLRPFEKTDVEVERDSLPDTNLAPALPGWSMMARPGTTQTLDFPVVRVWSIRGRILETAAGLGHGLQGIPVQLRSFETGEVVAIVHSEQDGYYEFLDIRSGLYQVEADAEALAGRGLGASRPRLVSTSALASDYTGLDMVTAPEGLSAVYPSLTGTGTTVYTPLGTNISTAKTREVRPHHALVLGYSRSRLGVSMAWATLKRRAPELFTGLGPIVTNLDSARVAALPSARYPLRVGPIYERERAESICDTLRANKLLCTVVPSFELPEKVIY